MAKAVSADRINKRASKDKAFLKRALRNPGLRSKLDPKYLSSGQRKSRALSTRLNSPITPGSTVTGRDLAHEAEAASTVKYGPTERENERTLGRAVTTERDTGSFYDQYQAQLAQHASNVQSFQAGAQQALAQTAAGITGLSGEQGAAMQQQANQGAAQQGVAQAGNLAPLASQAAAVRQQLMGSFQAQQAGQGAAANTHAGTQANVVAPAQKLSAVARARGKTEETRRDITSLATQKGAFNQQYRAERKADEFKNVLAQGALSLNTTKAAADVADDTTRSVETERSHRATERNRAADRRARVQKAGESAAAAGSKRTTSGPFQGMTKSQIDGLSDSQAQAKIDAYKKDGGSATEPATAARRDFRKKYGVDLQTTTQHNSARDSASNAQTAFGQVGKKVGGKVVTTDQVVAALRSGAPGVSKTSPLWIRVGLEVARGGITPGTAHRIHKAGYSVGSLGLKMRR